MITLDHPSGLVSLGSKEGRPGAPIRVPPGRAVYLRVTGTNTALYEYKLDSSTEVDAPEAEALKTFLRAAGPYAVDVLGTVANRAALADSTALTQALKVELTTYALALDGLTRAIKAEINGTDGTYDGSQ